jgi:hypothetical protein
MGKLQDQMINCTKNLRNLIVCYYLEYILVLFASFVLLVHQEITGSFMLLACQFLLFNISVSIVHTPSVHERILEIYLVYLYRKLNWGTMVLRHYTS